MSGRLCVFPSAPSIRPLADFPGGRCWRTAYQLDLYTFAYLRRPVASWDLMLYSDFSPAWTGESTLGNFSGGRCPGIAGLLMLNSRMFRPSTAESTSSLYDNSNSEDPWRHGVGGTVRDHAPNTTAVRRGERGTAGGERWQLPHSRPTTCRMFCRRGQNQ